MRRPIGLGLVLVGVLLLIFGISEADSFASDVSEFFTGNPTDRAMWLMIGGVAALVIGAGVALAPSTAKQSP